ncbi:MAG: hypothetical protein AAGC95_16235 [Pseudomonadota bacterium]
MITTEIKARFENSLPNGHSRDMWVKETLLEYERFEALVAKGRYFAPEKGSLLYRLLEENGQLEDRQSEEASPDNYISEFGHQPSYCWSIDISELSHGGGGAPATA